MPRYVPTLEFFLVVVPQQLFCAGREEYNAAMGDISYMLCDGEEAEAEKGGRYIHPSRAPWRGLQDDVVRALTEKCRSSIPCIY